MLRAEGNPYLDDRDSARLTIPVLHILPSFQKFQHSFRQQLHKISFLPLSSITYCEKQSVLKFIFDIDVSSPTQSTPLTVQFVCLAMPARYPHVSKRKLSQNFTL